MSGGGQNGHGTFRLTDVYETSFSPCWREDVSQGGVAWWV
jgi:hypothetical protein